MNGVARLQRQIYPNTSVLVEEVDYGQPCEICKEKCQGFVPHFWRKTCSSCKCPRESHDIYHKEWVNVQNRLGFDSALDTDRNNSKDKSFSEGYAWVPSGLPPDKISEYFQQIPSSKVPRLGSSGEKYRDKQLILQLPKQDLALAYCRHIENSQQPCYEDFINARNEIALDIGYVKDNIVTSTECPTCHQLIKPGDLGVIAPKFGEDVAWHPSCFICAECNEILVDLTYCVHDNLLYCERHYAEQLKPRCAGCDELMLECKLDWLPSNCIQFEYKCEDGV